MNAPLLKYLLIACAVIGKTSTNPVHNVDIVHVYKHGYCYQIVGEMDHAVGIYSTGNLE